jgi:hypothetical protein
MTSSKSTEKGRKRKNMSSLFQTEDEVAAGAREEVGAEDESLLPLKN